MPAPAWVWLKGIIKKSTNYWYGASTLFSDDCSTHENHPLICPFGGLDKTDADWLHGMRTMGYARAKNTVILFGHCYA